MKKTAFNIALVVCTVLVCIAAYFSGLKSFRELEPEDEYAAAVIQESDNEGENTSTEKTVSHKDCFWAVAKEHEEFKEDNCVAYAYEGDFDGDGKQEAFVIIGRADEETEETVFGNLLFIQDQYEIETIESVVFIHKDQTYIEKGTPDLFHFSYIDGITQKTEIFNMQEGKKEERASEYTEKEIAGEEFIPSVDLLERIRRAKADRIRVDFAALEYWHHNIRSVGCLDMTEHFTIYGLAEGLLVVTEQGNYIYGDFAYYDYYPEFEEVDLDNDGELELAILVAWHGTGFYVEDLYVADETREQGWKIYRLLMSEYKPVLEEHFGVVKEEGIVRFTFDGEKVGLPYEIPPEGEDYSYDYEIASQVEFSFVPDGRVLLDAVPDRISEISPIGFGPAHGVQAEVCREGDEWKISKVNYRDEGIDFVLEEGIPLWLAGAEKDFMAGYCADHDVQMPEEGTEISHNTVLYIDSNYPTDQVESGNVKAEVRVWLEGEEETIDFEVWVVYEDDEEREGWFIYKIEKEGVGH